MKRNPMTQIAVRKALKLNPDGLTVTGLAQYTGKDGSSIYKTIKGMPDVYIDRWTKAQRGPTKYTPVYAIADVPENAPRPD